MRQVGKMMQERGFLNSYMSHGQEIPPFANQEAENQEQAEMPDQQMEAKSFWCAGFLL